MWDFNQKVLCDDLVQDIFPTRGVGHNLLKIQKFTIRKSVKDFPILLGGRKHFLLCSLRDSWVGALSGKYILQLPSH